MIEMHFMFKEEDHIVDCDVERLFKDVVEEFAKKVNEDLEKEAGNSENINVGEINNRGKNKEKIEKENEKEKSFVENKEDGNEEIIMPKKNLRDEKEENRKEKEENAS